MTVTVANTLINNTVEFLRQRVNQIADVTTNQTVTVGGNSAVGDADITGTLRANTLYTYTLMGGSIGNNQLLTVGSNTKFNANVAIDKFLSVVNDISANNVVVKTKVTVGNTVLNTANIYSDSYFGTWTGNVISPVYGGTGANTIPTNGSLLIGNGSTYVNAKITQGAGVTVTNGPGSIQIDNIGVIAFRTSTNTANVYSAWRTGNVTLTGADVINAIGFIPSAANTNQWFNSGVDLNFYNGNVAIGYTDNLPRSYGKLQVLSTDTATNLPGVLIENFGNNATSGAYVGVSVANTSSNTGIRFQSNRAASGAIEYNPGTAKLSFSTGNVTRVVFDSANNVGIGVSVPQPNKGGSGIHVVANNAGITLDNGSGTAWHIGQNLNASYYGGTRQGGTFGMFSDSAGAGLTFGGSGTNSNFAIVVNNNNRMVITSNGGIQVGTTNLAPGALLQVGGDIVAEGNLVSPSDYRLKNNITDLSMSESIQRIKSLRPVTFRWNKSNHLEEGFIAHEVQEVVPTAVKGVKDAFDHQTLDKGQLTPVIVNAVQALINIVEEQQKEIERLKGR